MNKFDNSFFNGTHNDAAIIDERNSITEENDKRMAIECAKFQPGDLVKLSQYGIESLHYEDTGVVLKMRKNCPWLRVKSDKKGNGNYEPTFWEKLTT